MTSVPVPTFVPQDAWYALTLGNLTPNIADTVPLGVDLLPSIDANNQQNDGLVGALDGAVVYLAGLTSQLDGGQGWFMWVAASLRTSNGTTVFCPFVNASTPGRWISTGTANSGPGVVHEVQEFSGGADAVIAASNAPFVTVFIRGHIATGAMNLSLPGSAFLGQQFVVKDANGDAGTYNITVLAPSIDGSSSDVLSSDYQERTYTWNSAEWSVG
jgi:hypothetical protein